LDSECRPIDVERVLDTNVSDDAFDILGRPLSKEVPPCAVLEVVGARKSKFPLGLLSLH
jgi:hypothetical protein